MVTALYRRYRPETFAEMIGQAQVTEPLMTALRTGRVGHAYLFSGPRGCGKTTSARILARCLNCVEGPTDTPCGKCPSCVELSRAGGGSMDVVEIDAASHGGVDDARELRERAVFAPARDRYKIFIIDEAHMVTPGGFNALLKIVEEPPPHVKFIFATTEPEKVIGTIRSRTHHYPFRLVPPAALLDYTQQLCNSEGIAVEPGVLPLVVRAGGGSVRDTLSILDQLIAGSEDGRVTAERATGLLGYTSTELIDEVVQAFAQLDAAAAFSATDRVIQSGQDPRRFVEDLLERLRDLIVIAATNVEGAAAVFRGVPHDQLERMFQQSQAFAAGELSRIADITAAALDRMSGATAPRLQLELLVARALVIAEHLQQDAGGTNRATGTATGAAAAARPGGVREAQAPASTAGGAVPQQPAAAPAGGNNLGGPQGGSAAGPGVGMPGQPAAVAQPAGAAGAPAAPSVPPVRSAAQTAADIRSFLRDEEANDAAAAQATAQTAPVEPAAPATPPAFPQEAAAVRAEAALQTTPQEAAQATPQQGADSAQQQSADGQQTSGQQTSEQRAPGEQRIAPQSELQGEPAAQAQQPAQAQHPNAQAASFGRPISDILTPAQLDQIGTGEAFREPAPATPAVPATPDAAQQQGTQAAAQSQPEPTQAAEPATGVAATPAAVSAASFAPAASAFQQPQQTESHQSAAAETAPTETAAPAAPAESEFDDLLGLWPELLDELREQSEQVFAAVSPVQPLEFADGVLTIGLRSRAELDQFKQHGANPLREAILAATGITVRYLPRHLPPQQGQQTGAGRQAGSGSTAQQQYGEPTQEDDPESRAAARLSGLGPALAAPAWSDPPPAPPAQAQNQSQNQGTAPVNNAAPVGAVNTAPDAAARPAATVADATQDTALGQAPAQGTAPSAVQEEVTGSTAAADSTATATEQTVTAPASQAAAPQAIAPIQPAAPAHPTAAVPAATRAETPAETPADSPAQAAGSKQETNPWQAANLQQTPPPAQGTLGAQATPGAQQGTPAGQDTPAAQGTPAGPGAGQEQQDAAPMQQDPTQVLPDLERYGEAVVREKLKARFVREYPLPKND